MGSAAAVPLTILANWSLVSLYSSVCGVATRRRRRLERGQEWWGLGCGSTLRFGLLPVGDEVARALEHLLAVRPRVDLLSTGLEHALTCLLHVHDHHYAPNNKSIILLFYYLGIEIEKELIYGLGEVPR